MNKKVCIWMRFGQTEIFLTDISILDKHQKFSAISLIVSACSNFPEGRRLQKIKIVAEAVVLTEYCVLLQKL